MSYLERAALNFVNRVRGDNGLPKQPTLEQGMAHRSHDCPIARSIELDAVVLPNEVYLERQNYAVPLLVRLFIHLFDKGYYKHLRTNRPTRTMSRNIDHLDFIESKEKVLVNE